MGTYNNGSTFLRTETRMEDYYSFYVFINSSHGFRGEPDEKKKYRN